MPEIVATVPELVDAAAAAAPERVVAFPGCGETYRELSARSLTAAVALRRLGVGPGDFVGFLAPACLEVVELIVAAARLGAVIVPINLRFKAAEIGYLVNNADLRVLLVGGGFVELVREALPSLDTARAGRLGLVEAPSLRRVLLLDGAGDVDGAGGTDGVFESWPAELARAAGSPGSERADVTAAQAGIRTDDPVLMMYTSGTTARPRGCLHSHATVVHQGAALASRLRLTTEDRFWTPLPFFHVGGFDVLFSSLWARADMHHAGAFEPGVAVRQLARERCTVAFPAFETIWLPVLDHPEFPGADLSALRLVINVGTPERMRSMQARVPHAKQISCTGSTEAMGFCCVGRIEDDAESRASSCGPMVEGTEGRIVDRETGLDAPDGVPGEFLIRGTVRFLRYHRDPELTAARIDADGWYHTGDVLVRDARGRFAFVGRLDDRLKVGGENVAASEIEDFLAAHPAVGIVAVVGAADARYGEVAAAFVQLRPGASVGERELIDFCRGRIATYKVPRYVRFVEEWPMSGTKIQKFRLRARIAADLAARGITEAPPMSSSRVDQPVPTKR
jgi:fatty-acyl-CoA synthase